MSLPVPHSQGQRRTHRPQVDRPEVRNRRSEPEVYRVTTARTSLSEEQRFRTKRYLISMSIRTVCFLAAVFTPGWWRWAFLIGAVVLPYVAVIMANAGRENDPFTGPEQVTDIDLRALPAPNRQDPAEPDA